MIEIEDAYDRVGIIVPSLNFCYRKYDKPHLFDAAFLFHKKLLCNFHEPQNFM